MHPIVRAGGAAILLLLFMAGSCDDEDDTVATDEPQPTTTQQATTTAPTTTTEPAAAAEGNSAVSLKLRVEDRTEALSPGDRAEVWIRGMGSWFPDLEFGLDGREDVGPFPVGEVHEIYVYPDGRDEPEIIAEFVVTDDMISNSDRDHLWVDIYDDEVVVGGAPIEGYEVTVSR